ncbi:hypothetical protein LR48_Vigan226s001500 [Vigna angularis]|uniref:Uncharacterized protein n=1 Tax=Phaseolus angularis TaxID=3914 RepID=A0A0L9T6X3_PHAAN|nr:hypothetical protein LR48_Vigan226s001500 [Vigna angularis]
MNWMKEVKWDKDGIRKGHKKCKRREAASTAQRQLPLSGTFKDPLAPLRGKNASEEKNRRNAFTAERSGEILPKVISPRHRDMREAIRTRSKKTSEPLLKSLDESRQKRRIRTSRELFPLPETLLQPSPQGSHHSTEEMENNNVRRTLADYTNC